MRAAMLITGTGVSVAAFAASHSQIFAQTLIGNITPLMIMAALGWFARVIRGARINYHDLCEKVEHLEQVVVRLENRLSRRKWWHRG